jgi:dolichol kinase
LGHTRSLEGSAAFFVAGGLFTWLALWLHSGSPDLTPAAAFMPALVVIAATTVTEAVSPWGMDNLSVTAVSVIILSLWSF